MDTLRVNAYKQLNAYWRDVELLDTAQLEGLEGCRSRYTVCPGRHRYRIVLLRNYGVRRHFPTSQLAEIYFSYSSLKTHPIIKK